MSRLLSKSMPVARKKYDCMASEWIDNVLLDNLHYYELTITELKQIIRARRQGWCILPGQQYVKLAIVMSDGFFYVFRAIPEMHQICLKHNIYPDDD